jgi:hypothetical protein
MFEVGLAVYSVGLSKRHCPVDVDAKDSDPDANIVTRMIAVRMPIRLSFKDIKLAPSSDKPAYKRFHVLHIYTYLLALKLL